MQHLLKQYIQDQLEALRTYQPSQIFVLPLEYFTRLSYALTTLDLVPEPPACQADFIRLSSKEVEAHLETIEKDVQRFSRYFAIVFECSDSGAPGGRYEHFIPLDQFALIRSYTAEMGELKSNITRLLSVVKPMGYQSPELIELGRTYQKYYYWALKLSTIWSSLGDLKVLS